jgi:hypothetical protein
VLVELRVAGEADRLEPDGAAVDEVERPVPRPGEVAPVGAEASRPIAIRATSRMSATASLSSRWRATADTTLRAPGTSARVEKNDGESTRAPGRVEP